MRCSRRLASIYVRRDPIDTCLSCYFNQFSSAHNFKLDLADLAHYYREHERLAAHWRAVLPAGTLLEVPYAELVEDQAGVDPQNPGVHRAGVGRALHGISHGDAPGVDRQLLAGAPEDL